MATALLKRKGASSFDDIIVGPGFSGGTYRNSKTAMTSAPAGATATSSSGRPVSITPSAKTTPNPNLDAKNLPYKEAGSGNAWVGITADNVFANIDKLRSHQTEKAGGSKEAWGNLTRWSTTNTGPHADKAQLAAFDKYITTGVRDPSLKTETALAATDWTFRDQARGQQNKKNFLDSTLGKILTVGAEIAVTVATGNPYAAMAIGAASGGLKQKGGGWMGAAFGAASGYGVGAATNWVANGGITALTQPANGAGITATGGGTGAANVAANVGNVVKSSVASTVGSFGLKEAATAVSAASGVKQLLTGAAVTGAAAAVGGALAAPAKPNAITAAPQPAELTPEEKFQQQMLKRRRAVATNLSWGSNSSASLGRPTLLGQPVRLGA